MSSNERMNGGRPWMARRVIAAVLCGAVTGLLVAPLPSFAQGTAPLPELVKDMFTGTAGLTPSGWPPGRPRRVANVNGALYLDVYFNDLSDGASQPQNSVWRSDGTAGGTVPAYWPTSVNGRLFLTDVFSTNCPVSGADCFEVWKADRSGWPETLVQKLGARRVAFPLDLNGSLFFVTYKDWLGTSLEPSITVSNLLACFACAAFAS